jgi:hypothetical protein
MPDANHAPRRTVRTLAGTHHPDLCQRGACTCPCLACREGEGPCRRAGANHTPRRTVRVPDDVWQPAQEKAATEGTNVSAVVNRKLAEYIEGEDET